MAFRFTITENDLADAIFCQCSLPTRGDGTMAEARQQARAMLAGDELLLTLKRLTESVISNYEVPTNMILSTRLDATALINRLEGRP